LYSVFGSVVGVLGGCGVRMKPNKTTIERSRNNIIHLPIRKNS
jgi:hypothetical protein